MSGKYGDWAQVERMLSQAGNKLKREVGKATGQLGAEFVRIIVDHFDKQDLGWSVRKEPYKSLIEKAGYTQVLIVTGTLEDNITAQQLDAWSGYVSALRREEKKGYDLAWIHEFGSRDGRIPARPYMRPSKKEFEPVAKAEYQAAVERAFKP